MEHRAPVFSLEIDATAKAYLAETARWGRFLAIVGFVLCAIVVIVGLFFGTFMGAILGSSVPGDSSVGAAFSGSLGVFMGIFYALFALLYFFPCLYLFRFSGQMRRALDGESQVEMTTAFQNLKSLFKFVGIFTIILLSIYALVLVIGVIGFAAGR